MASKTKILSLTKPDLNDKVGDTIDALAKNFEALSLVYPIGYVLISTRSDNPGTYLGGTWQQIQGRMLIGQSSDFPAGTVGGEKEHVLTVNEMPDHNHTLLSNDNDGTKTGWGVTSTNGQAADNSSKVGSTGGGAAHNNMPPYKSVYMWERVA